MIFRNTLQYRYIYISAYIRAKFRRIHPRRAEEKQRERERERVSLQSGRIYHVYSERCTDRKEWRALVKRISKGYPGGHQESRRARRERPHPADGVGAGVREPKPHPSSLQRRARGIQCLEPETLSRYRPVINWNTASPWHYDVSNMSFSTMLLLLLYIRVYDCVCSYFRRPLYHCFFFFISSFHSSNLPRFLLYSAFSQ